MTQQNLSPTQQDLSPVRLDLPSAPGPVPTPRPQSGPGTPSSRAARSRPSKALGLGAFALTSLAVAVAAPKPYFTQTLDQLATSDRGLSAHYADQPAVFQVALLVHAATGGLALLLSPLQLSARLRRGRSTWHRGIGFVLVPTILAGAASGLVVAQVSYAGLVGALGFSSLSLLWALSVVQAARSAVRGDRSAHRAWSIRTLALTFAAVTLRAWLVVLIIAQRPGDADAIQLAFDHAYPVMPFLCWVPNLLIAEWLVRRRGTR